MPPFRWIVRIAHDNVRKKMQTEHDRRITNLAVSLPTITFSDQFTLHMSGEEIHAVHFAHGHSDGDSVVFYPEANVVQMGDDFTNFAPPHYPAIDTDNDGSGGPQGAIAAAQYVLEHSPSDVKIVPGHGSLGSKADLSNYLALLQATSAAVQAGIAQGKSLDQLKQEKVLAKWEYLDSPAIRTDVYLERLYKGLLQEGTGDTKGGGY
jgi:cyclase